MAQDSSWGPPGRTPQVEPAEAHRDSFTIALEWRRWWTIIPEIVTLTCTAILALLVAANVVSRYTDLFRILWAEDVIGVLFQWVVFLGGAIAVKYEAHVRMSTLSGYLERRGGVGALWGQAIRLSPVLMGTMLLVLGVRVVDISMRRELPSLQISVGYFTTVIPASGALMIFYALRAFRGPRGRRAAVTLEKF